MTGLTPERIMPLLCWGDHADLFAEDSRYLTIRWEDGRIDDISAGTDAGFGLRYVDGDTVIFGHQNALSDDAAGAMARGLTAGLRQARPPAPVIETGPVHHPVLIDPSSVALDRKTALLENIYRHIRDAGPGIAQVICLYVERLRRSLVCSSAGRTAEESKLHSMLMVTVVAGRGGLLQTATELIGGLGGFELVEEAAVMDHALSAARRAAAKVSAPPAPAGEMPVVLAASAGGTMIHEAVGHSLEADAVQKGISPVYRGRRGEQVASPRITVIDDPTLPGKRGSYAWDDEGEPAVPAVLIDRGRLATYLYDICSARKDGAVSNGHGRRQSYRNRPIPRMANTYIRPGGDEPSAIIGSLSDGLLVTRMGGGQVNTASGDFVFEVEEGYRVASGRVQELVRGASLLGNGPAVLGTIDMVGNDLGWGLGTCGKDGQSVPVSDAQPTLRIPQILVGGNA